MLIPDHEIRRLCQMREMVSPYVEAHLNPASLDVTLGDRIMIEVTGTRELEITGIHNYSEEQPYWIKPGEFFWLKPEKSSTCRITLVLSLY